MSTGENLRDLRGLAADLQLPIDWLVIEADEGRIPCLRVRRRRLFNIDAVRRALAERAASGFERKQCQTSQ